MSAQTDVTWKQEFPGKSKDGTGRIQSGGQSSKGITGEKTCERPVLKDDKKSEVFPKDPEEKVWDLLQPGSTELRTSVTDKVQQAGRSGRIFFFMFLVFILNFLYSK